MTNFSEYRTPIIFMGEDEETYYFVLKYTVANFNTTACTVPVPSEPMLLNRVVWIDHIDVRYTHSSTSYDPVKMYLSIYPAGQPFLGQQKGTRYTSTYDEYVQWQDINQWVIMTDPSTYFAAIAPVGYTATDDMHCRVIGHFKITKEEKERRRELVGRS